MSQEKVDKRKYEKKHRAEIMRKQKRAKIAGWIIFGVLLGALLGSTLGVKIYNSIPKYVEAEKLGAFVNEVWAENGYGDYFTATVSDAEEETDDTTDTEEDTSDTEEDTTDTEEDTASSDESAE